MQLIKLTHKWASLFVGIQLILWLISGLYFNIMDPEKASGRIYLKQNHKEVSIKNKQLIEPKTVLANYPASQSVKLIQRLGKPYYLLTHKTALYRHFDNNYSLVDAYSGETQTIDKNLAIEIAKQSYGGPGKVSTAIKLLPPLDDIPKEQNQVWQVNFDDPINTSVYVDAGSGHMISHSNDDKRFADIFFMLHFMDYGTKGDFNSWQMILFAVVTLWLTLTGVIWIIQLWASGDYKPGYFSRQREVQIKNNSKEQLGKFVFSEHANLLDSLAEQSIALPSSCGGGGTCGRCEVKFDEKIKITSADKHHFSIKELDEGFRLACQHKCKEFHALTVLKYTSAKKRTLTLTQSTFLSPYIKELKFKVEGNEQLKFKAGAYMRFFIPKARGYSVPKELPEKYQPHWQHIEHLKFKHIACSRSYSIANYDTQSNELVFTIKIQSAPNNKALPGIGSNYLCNLVTGQSVKVIGPFEEFFTNPNSNKDMVLIGAGAGMAPLRALIYEQLEKYNSKKTIHFYFGARNEQELIYYKEFKRLSIKHENFYYYPVLSRADDGWSGLKGYVQDAIKNDLDVIGDVNQLEFYLCGPKQMMIDNIKLLRSIGVDENSIAFDDFTPN